MGQGGWGWPGGGALDAGPWGSRCPEELSILISTQHFSSPLRPGQFLLLSLFPGPTRLTPTLCPPCLCPLLTFPALSSKTQPKPYLPPPPESPPWLINLHSLGVFHGMYRFLDVLHSVLCVCSNLPEMSCQPLSLGGELSEDRALIFVFSTYHHLTYNIFA